MLIAIDADDPRPIYVQIMDEVRRARVLGTIRPEEPLPSVRQLAAELRVNPNTVSQAYRELERDGLVYVRRGQGTFLTDSSPNGTERRALAHDVAARALSDAHRHGLGASELVDAIQQIAATPSPEDPR
ncbi:MAG: GntR family transcriptional regulator [Gemmatimonadota bacterium]|nr:GntR family transcriptional regulator [Gemmatimonadota bacterium]